MVSATSSSPAISDLGDHIFRYWNDADTSKAMLAYIREQGGESIAIIYENTDYAVAYADAVLA